MTDPATPTTSQQSLADRYGQSKQTSRRLRVFVIALISLALLGLLGWVAWSNGHPPVTADVHSYDVVSPHLVKVTVDFSTASAPARCTVSAQAVDHSVVGEQVIRLPTDASGQSLVTSLRTSREATTATVGDCR
ncbi:MAG: DUF4307 domain-containing protein [Nocardioidaceae bacterium]